MRSKTVRIVSKPLVYPWNDATKNLLRLLLTHSKEYRYRYFGNGGPADFHDSNVQCDPIVVKQTSFNPSLMENLRPFLFLMRPESGIDIYHFFFSPNPRTNHTLRLLFKVKRGLTVHTLCSCPSRISVLYRSLFADRIVVLSDHTGRILQQHGMKNVVRIYPGIEPPKVDAARVKALGEKLGLRQEDPCVVFSGDYEYSKAHSVILTALPEIVRDCKNLRFIFACRHKTSAAREIEKDVRQSVETSGLTPRVTFMNDVDDFGALLKLASVVIFPVQSLHNKMDLPLTLLEAMALRRPIVISDLGPLPELLPRNGGMKIPPGDAAALHRAVSTLLHNDDLRLEMGQTGSRLVNEFFSAKRMAVEYEKLYRSLLNGLG